MSDAPQKHTLEDIAAMMAANRQQMVDDGHYPSAQQPEKQPDQVPNQVVPEATEEETPPDGTAGESSQLDAADEGEQGAESLAPEDDQSPAETTEPEPKVEEPELPVDHFELSDDDLIEVEGLDEPIAIKALKEAYTADKDIPAKLEVAKAQEQAATDKFRQVEADAVKMGEAMQALAAGMEQMVSQPLVRAPDATLKSTNPGEYIRQSDAYAMDQQRIKQSRDAMLQSLDGYTEQVKEHHNQRKQHELGVLLTKVAPLRSEDAATKAAASDDILKAAEHYGFSSDEIANAADHRMFHMAYEAAQYRKLMAEKDNPTNTEERVNKIKRTVATTPRVIRAGGTRPVNQATKVVKATASKAKKTGKPTDVAAFMAASRRAGK